MTASTRLVAVSGILLALVLLSFTPVAAAQSYTVTDLGTLGGGFSSARAINDSGQVVGEGSVSDGSYHAFLWSKETGMRDLGVLHPADSDSYAIGINTSGEVVGYSGTYAFLWTESNGMQDMGSLGGGNSVPFAINDSGQVVGSSTTAGSAETHAFIWTQTGGMQDLGTLGGNYSSAFGINSAGQVVGSSRQSDNVTYRAFLWTKTGGMQDLGSLDGGTSVAFGINTSGQVVGDSSYLKMAGLTVAFLWDPKFAMRSLGTTSPTAVTFAEAINASGRVVGIWSNGQPQGFLWTKARGLQNINWLIPANAPRVSVVYGINKLGQIAGSGSTHALLLTPTQ